MDTGGVEPGVDVMAAKWFGSVRYGVGVSVGVDDSVSVGSSALFWQSFGFYMESKGLTSGAVAVAVAVVVAKCGTEPPHGGVIGVRERQKQQQKHIQEATTGPDLRQTDSNVVHVHGDGVIEDEVEDSTALAAVQQQQQQQRRQRQRQNQELHSGDAEEVAVC
ncbi:GL25189 [Drosophila persimilis]|uniref:GL25189 n=1 Tax=Drosophila persimilis TaxID=7234 RepID=B4GRE4_DROPE|nr:GL25189 [Drosophila persimilis]